MMATVSGEKCGRLQVSEGNLNCTFLTQRLLLLLLLFLMMMMMTTKYIILFLQRTGYCGSKVVKVLCYKSEGRCFDPSWC